MHRGARDGEVRTATATLLYGKKPHVYRVIYQIDEQRQLVTVLAIRHGAREPAELH